jgi:hypothetical protein
VALKWVENVAPVQQVQELVALLLSDASFGGQEQLVAQVPHLRIGGGRITFGIGLRQRDLNEAPLEVGSRSVHGFPSKE